MQPAQALTTSGAAPRPHLLKGVVAGAIGPFVSPPVGELVASVDEA